MHLLFPLQNLAPTWILRIHRSFIVRSWYVDDVEVISAGILQLTIQGFEERHISGFAVV